MMRRAALFGGSYWNDDDAGSRQANVGNWPDNSNENYGARGRSDDRFLVRHRSRPCRRTTISTKVGGQPGHPASANTSRGPAERGVVRHMAYRDPRPAFVPLKYGRSTMGKHYRNLIGAIASPDNLAEAYRLTSRGKRGSAGYLEFKEFAPLNLDELATDMQRGTYRPGPEHQFRIRDPKPRIITALSFRDRVAQQALVRIIGPIFDRGLLPNTFACRRGKGTHAGAVAVQAAIRHMGRRGDVHVLKTDFSKYFASIDRAVLWRLIEAKVSCAATLRLIEAIVPRDEHGLPIGSLTSQVFANVYGGQVDRFLQDSGERNWFRYMDDVVVLGHDPSHLRDVRDRLAAFALDDLGLTFSKWSVASAGRGINFLGYRIFATHKLLRRDSVTRARRKIAAYRNAGDRERLRKFLAAWTGHARWADTANLLRALGVEIDDA